MKVLTKILKRWIPLAVTLTLICGIVYITVQQDYRLSANDPQTQMVVDAVNSLNKGIDPKSLVTGPQLDLALSLSPYLMIYDASGNPIASGVLLNGNLPYLPFGVLAYVRQKGEDVISWQPQDGIRQALVIRKTNGNNLYFVAAGRSLKKTEERIAMLGKQVTFGWIFSLGILLVVSLGFSFNNKP